MSIKTFLINSTTAQYNDNELSWLQSALLEEGIVGDSSGVLGLQVTENAIPDMDVLVSIGKALVEITISGETFKVIVDSNAEETLTVANNTSGSNRVDAVIVRVDVDTEPNALKNNVGTIELVLGTGVSALTDGAIDTAVGSDGWYRLANITVVDSETTLLNADIDNIGIKVATNEAIDFTDYLGDSIKEEDVTQAGSAEEKTVSTDIISCGEGNTSGDKNSLAQKFVASRTKYRGAELYKKADTGTFTGTVKISLQADSLGDPSGTDLASIILTNQEWLDLEDNTLFEALFSSEYASVVIGNTYYIDIQPSTADDSNHINLGADTSGGDGTIYYHNTIDGWVAIASSYLYYKTLEGINEQVVKTKTNGKIDHELIDEGSFATPSFYQMLGLKAESPENITANEDGTIIVVQCQTVLVRFEKNSLGAFEQTHEKAISSNFNNVAIVGDYVYVGYLTPDMYRYDLADLTNETILTPPNDLGDNALWNAGNGKLGASDTDGGTGTFSIYTILGTALTQESNGVMFSDTARWSPILNGFDGKVYLPISETEIKIFDDPEDLSSPSSTATIVDDWPFGSGTNPVYTFIIPLSDSFSYYAQYEQFENASSSYDALRMIPRAIPT